MIPRHQLPDDAAEWTTIAVSFPRLPDDTPESCPKSIDDILEYIRAESADLDDADVARLVFNRTALVGEFAYWLWIYTESDGQLEYVVFRMDSRGSTLLGITETNGLTPEQYMLADYYDDVYWP